MADQQTTAAEETTATPEVSAEESSFDKRQAAAEAMTARQKAERRGDDDDPAKPEPKPEETEDAAEDEKPEDKPSEVEDPVEKLAAIKAALDEGDLATAAKLSGVSPKKLSTHGKRLSTIRRKEQSVDKKLAALDTREAKLHADRLATEQTYGNPKKAAEAYHAGRYYEAAKYMSGVFGDSFTVITQKIARETAGLSPEKLAELEEREKFQREKREFEENKKREEARGKQTQSRAQQLSTLKSKLSDHPVVKADRGVESVADELQSLWDADLGSFKGGLTPGQALKRAADNVLERKRAEAVALGLVPTAPVKPKPKPKDDEKPTVADSDAKAAAGKDGKRRLSFEERMAIAERKTARQRGRA